MFYGHYLTSLKDCSFKGIGRKKNLLCQGKNVHVSENQSFGESCFYVACRKPHTKYLLPAGHHVQVVVIQGNNQLPLLKRDFLSQTGVADLELQEGALQIEVCTTDLPPGQGKYCSTIIYPDL
jgi:hypothetical protein